MVHKGFIIGRYKLQKYILTVLSEPSNQISSFLESFSCVTFKTLKAADYQSSLLPTLPTLHRMWLDNRKGWGVVIISFNVSCFAASLLWQLVCQTNFTFQRGLKLLPLFPQQPVERDSSLPVWPDLERFLHFGQGSLASLWGLI